MCDALPSKKHAFRNRLESADNQIHPEEGMKMEEQMYRCGEDIKQIRQWGYHKTFFEEDYQADTGNGYGPVLYEDSGCRAGRTV